MGVAEQENMGGGSCRLGYFENESEHSMSDATFTLDQWGLCRSLLKVLVNLEVRIDDLW